MKKRLQKAITAVEKVIALAEAELVNPNSQWRKELVENVVLPEMRELHEHFLNGERYFKYTNTRGILRIKQRQLLSTYHILETLLIEKLNLTELGQAISDFQKIYDRL